jgi:hypothetical protein
VTPELQAQIDTAIAALPAAHQQAPYKGEITDSKEAALQRLQDWAFTHGFAIAIEFGSKNRVRFEYVHYKTRLETPGRLQKMTVPELRQRHRARTTSLSYTSVSKSVSVVNGALGQLASIIVTSRT